MKLTFSGAADGWKQGLPLGNGRLGAVAHGGAAGETWCVTEATYWSGQAEPPATPSRGKADVAAMRELFYAGDYAAGEEMASRLLQAEKGNFGTNLSLCDVVLSFGGGAAAEEAGAGLVRELNLEEALYGADFAGPASPGIARELLASHPDNVLAARLWSGAGAAGGVTFALRLEGRTDRFAVEASGEGLLAFEGQATETMHSDGTCGVLARGAVKVVARGGSVAAADGAIVVDGADEAYVYLAVETDYRQPDGAWAQAAAGRAEAAAAKGYAAIRAAHVADYRSLYARVEADFGDSGASALPLGERMRRLRDGHDDPQLFALFFQYGRYLTIAGSRADSALPMHLQGIWNDGEANRMAWSCDYHLDVNTEMNYYPTEAANLAECHMPLLRYVERLAETGRATAREYYGSDGWVAHVFIERMGLHVAGLALFVGPQRHGRIVDREPAAPALRIRPRRTFPARDGVSGAEGSGAVLPGLHDGASEARLARDGAVEFAGEQLLCRRQRGAVLYALDGADDGSVARARFVRILRGGRRTAGRRRGAAGTAPAKRSRSCRRCGSARTAGCRSGWRITAKRSRTIGICRICMRCIRGIGSRRRARRS